MTISWNTATDVGTRVEYGLTPGSLTLWKDGTSFKASADELGYIHQVTLTDLAPHTTYYYRAGDSTDGFSAEQHFTTGPEAHPECGEFSFLFLGDNRPDEIFGGGENYDTILGQAFAHGPAFTINGGDLVEDGENVSEWLNFLGYGEDTFDSIPYMAAIGNHDTGPGDGDSAYYNQIFAFPYSSGTGASLTEDHYYFTYGNAIFVALSTENFKSGAIPFADQAAWLDEVLTNNPKRWKIVYYHSPSYTYQVAFDLSHPPDEESQNAALIPIMDKHHVDMVLTSHNHWYERFEPSACADQGDPGSDDPCSVGDGNYDQGTVYVVSGGAGAFTIPGILCWFYTGRAECSGSHHYLLFQVTSDTLTMETWGANPEPNEILDAITISKPPANCTAVTPDAGPGPDTPDAATGTPDASPGTPDAHPGVADGGSSSTDGSSAADGPGSGCCGVAGDRAPGGGTWLLVLLVGLILRRRRCSFSW